MKPDRLLLGVQGVSVSFGGLRAIQAVDLEIQRNEIVGLIGPNGAGKTTLFNVITRVYRPDRGDVWFDGSSLLRLAPHEVIGRGIARTFQNLLLFNRLTVRDNVMVGLHARSRAGLVPCALRLPRTQTEERTMRRRCDEVLRLVGLDGAADQLARNLPFGHQRLLEFARALASGPTLLLLDEPGAGLTAEELDGLMRLIGRIRSEEGVTIFLIGHTMRLVLGISDRVIVLDHGVKIAEGTPEQIRAHPDVIQAYLGKPESGVTA